VTFYNIKSGLCPLFCDTLYFVFMIITFSDGAALFEAYERGRASISSYVRASTDLCDLWPWARSLQREQRCRLFVLKTVS